MIQFGMNLIDVWVPNWYIYSLPILQEWRARPVPDQALKLDKQIDCFGMISITVQFELGKLNDGCYHPIQSICFFFVTYFYKDEDFKTFFYGLMPFWITLLFFPSFLDDLKLYWNFLSSHHVWKLNECCDF